MIDVDVFAFHLVYIVYIGCGSQKQLESQKQEYEKLVAQHMDSTARVTALEAEKQEMIQLLNEAVSTADQIRVSGSYHWLMRRVMNMADQIRVSGSCHWLMRRVMNMADQIRVSGSYHWLMRRVMNMADQSKWVLPSVGETCEYG